LAASPFQESLLVAAHHQKACLYELKDSALTEKASVELASSKTHSLVWEEADANQGRQG